MKQIKTSQLIKRLNLAGYHETRQAGSHLTLKNAEGLTVTIVNDTLQSQGVIRNISKLTGINFFENNQETHAVNSLPVNFWDVCNQLDLNPFTLSNDDKSLILSLC